MGEVDTDQGTGPDDQNHDAERPVVPVPATGHAGVDDAVAGLSRLPALPVADHVAILEEVHGRLRDILDELAEPAGADPAQPPRPSGDDRPADPVRQRGRP